MADGRSSEPTVICAWCGLTVHEGGGGPVSHGICDVCAMQLLSQAGVLSGEPRPVSDDPVTGPMPGVAYGDVPDRAAG
jgi:hypothetical protein